MMNYFYMGGPLFMGILTLILLAMIVVGIRKGNVKEIGLLALAVGFLGQLLGLVGAFEGIEQMGGVSQAILVGGLKVSSIPAIYGLIIYSLSLIARLIQNYLK